MNPQQFAHMLSGEPERTHLVATVDAGSDVVVDWVAVFQLLPWQEPS